MKTKLLLTPIIAGLAISAANLSHAQDVLPTFKCMLTDKLEVFRWPGIQKDSFGHNDAKIYFICDSNNAVTGDSIRAVWLADHTYNQKKSYETIGVKTLRVVKRRNGGEIIEADLSMAKPLKGWKVGEYHIQVYINGIEGYQYKFVIR